MGETTTDAVFFGVTRLRFDTGFLVVISAGFGAGLFFGAGVPLLTVGVFPDDGFDGEASFVTKTATDVVFFGGELLRFNSDFRVFATADERAGFFFGAGINLLTVDRLQQCLLESRDGAFFSSSGAMVNRDATVVFIGGGSGVATT